MPKAEYQSGGKIKTIIMKTKLLTLLVTLIVTSSLWASNVITYTATSRLSGYNGSLSVGRTTFGPAITSHTFSNGKGTIVCAGEITTIGYRAFFHYCSGLTSVTIPNSVTTIGYGAFYYCSGLTSVTIPNSVTTIGEYAFSHCSGLTSVTIGNSVKKIGDNAFYNCSVRTITCYAVNPPTATGATFNGISQYTKTYVLASSLENYQFAIGWRDLNLFPIEETGIFPVLYNEKEGLGSDKFIHNGQLFILRNGVLFNARGARVK